MKLNCNQTELRMTAGRADQFPNAPIPQIAFSGRSNVGKSSLINTLIGRKSLARVSATPGKTITVNFYEVDKKIFLVDLPGYGYARRTFEEQKVWSSLVDGYFTKNPNIDRLVSVVQLVDSRAGMTKDDRDMIAYLKEAGIPFCIVLTKVDKLNQTERKKSVSAVTEDPLTDGAPVIPFSAETKEGKNELWAMITAAAESFGG